jgi:hypothetical protein
MPRLTLNKHRYTFVYDILPLARCPKHLPHIFTCRMRQAPLTHVQQLQNQLWQKITDMHRSYCKVPVIFSDFNQDQNLSISSTKNPNCATI